MMFSLNEKVWLSLSKEEGIVVGRAEYVDNKNSYLVRYIDRLGCQKEEWFSESNLVGAKKHD